MNLKDCLFPAACAALAGCAAAPFPESPAFGEDPVPARRNIVIIMTDQQRADLCGREGFPCDLTPFADRMGQEGAWFSRAYSPCPISGPARVSTMTGRFAGATHADSNHNLPDAVFGKDIFEVAREAGYATALVGKNHSHLTPDRVDFWDQFTHTGQKCDDALKSEAGAEFDRYLKTLHSFADFSVSPGGPESQQPYRMVDDALRWTESLGGERPFVMWFAVNEPHNPYQVCEPYWSMFDGQIPAPDTSPSDAAVKGEKYELMQKQMYECHIGIKENLERVRASYMGMIRLIDDQLARLAEGFREQGLLDNTVFVITSDHGDYCGEYGLMKKGAGLDEATTRIPMVWFGSGIRPCGQRTDCVSLVDIMPTACEIMGQPIPAGVQGRSLLDMLEGRDYPAEEFRSVMSEHGFGGQYITAADDPAKFWDAEAVGRAPFYDELNTWSQSGHSCMVRMGDWKYICDMHGQAQLYNLARDPRELRNLAGKARWSRRELQMTRELLKWTIAANDPIPVPRKRYTQKRYKHNYLFKGETE